MKKKILARRVITIMLMVLILAPLFPVAARAADATISTGGQYNLADYGSGSVITISTTDLVLLYQAPGTVFTNLSINCTAAGVNLAIRDINIGNSANENTCALSFTGAGNTLTLVSSSKLKSGKYEPGIRVNSGTGLTIKGSGSVEATGGWGCAGIGSEMTVSSGTITISGNAQVTATGGMDGAGIGSGYNGGYGIYCGTITIFGNAQVTANGGACGAGIGNGYESRGGSITISGGTVFAAGGSSAQDIGRGYSYYSNGGSLSISGDDTAVFLRNDSSLTPSTSSHTHMYTRNTINGQLYGYTMPSASWTSVGAYLPNSRYYILTYDANGGTGSDANAHLPGGGPVTIGSTRISRTGYTFAEWNTSPGGDGTPYAPGDELTMTADTTVYAIWAKIPVDNVSLNKTELDMYPGDIQTLLATVSPNNAAFRQVTWQSDNTFVVTVNSTGVVTANGVGFATITATADGISATCEVEVWRPVTSIKFNMIMYHNDTAQLVSDITPHDATYQEMTWTSSNEAIVTVGSSGVVEAVGIGTVTVTGATDELAQTFNITVIEKPVTGVQLIPPQAEMKNGEPSIFMPLSSLKQPQIPRWSGRPTTQISPRYPQAA